MSELRELYQEVILDHGKSPRNFGKPEAVTGESHGHNPLCGDTVTIYVTVDGGTVTDIGFEGRGCAISMASASMMTELLQGKSIKEVQAMFAEFHALVASAEPACEAGFETPDLDKLIVLAGVREFPMRVKCATLPWHTMKAALDGEGGGDGEEITTE